MKINSHTILRRANDFEISVDSAHTIVITAGHRRQSFPNQALMVLAIFAQPLPLQEGLKKLQAAGLQDWIQLTSIVVKLQKMRVLVDHAQKQISSDKNPAAFGAAPVHIGMLNDKTRTDSFMTGLRETVRPGDIVLDIGTGTGILAIAAARAGAKKVYGIEASAMADVAQATIDKTEVADKITLIRGWSTQVELPEKADVLVSEILGNDPFDENILQTFLDARKRLLKPGARVLPDHIGVWALPVMIPSVLLQNKVLQPRDLDNWQSWYGVDFSALKQVKEALSRYLFNADTESVKQLKYTDRPLLLTEVDMATFSEVVIKNEITATAANPFNGFLMYFESHQGTSILSTHPQVADEANSWVSPVWYVPEAQDVKPGDTFTIRYKYIQGSNSEITLLTHQ